MPNGVSSNVVNEYHFFLYFNFIACTYKIRCRENNVRVQLKLISVLMRARLYACAFQFCVEKWALSIAVE